MATCPSCCKDLPGEFPFCPFCTAPLSAQSAPSVHEERKVVSVLFCDLVGFTASSEQADPEDVDRMLSAYAEMARARIEAHGGVVEKFIGDAVVGVFGVPAAHEDDPERAVRAGLRIVEGAEELQSVGGEPLRLRVGINTGEALVRLRASAGLGERVLAGNAINTASRIQSVAPEMGVAVGLATYEATAPAFDYSELEPATLKGKAEPVRVFQAKAARARFGTDLTRTHHTPFVGREIDLALLKGIFDKTVASSSVQLVTVVGEPGLGKSRLVAELFAYIDARPELTTWRQGRCLPYGEGITFWALGEILKAHAGILESDPSAVAQAKLAAVLPEGEEREWFRQRLLPLLGIEATSSAEREELFTAWRRFLERIAEARPTVLVFEDLHWADEAMLAFLEHLTDLAEGVPLLLVGTARPELYERHPDYGARLRNATPINLVPLSQEETARLVSALLESTVIPAELQQPILERAGGNPLYAEEFVRLLKDRNLLARKGSRWEFGEGAEVPFPESVQALIAARLDTLEPDAKSLLADAAVIGKVFWAGAVAAMGERDLQTVTSTLRELSRKELVRPARLSSMTEEAEYAFSHILVRDVAHGQLPRPSRVRRHIAAATWLEAKAGERVDDIADVLAYHYATAFELARAAGQTDQAAELEAPALRFLTLAGERALNLDVAAACTSLRRALELASEGHPARARILTLLARGEDLSGRLTEAVRRCEEAVAAYRTAGDEAAADDATCDLSRVVMNTGDVARSESLLDELLRRLEGEGPSELLALVYCSKQYHHQEDLTWAEKALTIAEHLHLTSVRQRALNMRGLARAALLGDPGGTTDLRASLALALEQQATRDANVTYVNLATCLALHDPAAALEVADEGIAFASARGLSPNVKAIRQWVLLRLGRWDELLEAGQEIVSAAEPFGHRWIVGHATAPMALVLTRRGATDAAGELARTSSSELTKEFFHVPPIVAHRTRGALAEAERLLEGAVQFWVSAGAASAWFDLCDLARETTALRRPDLLETLLTMPDRDQGAGLHTKTTCLAIAAEAVGRHDEALALFQDAERGWRQSGDPYERAHSLLGQTRCLMSLERANEAVQPLNEARDLFAQLDAAPALAETDQLLQEAAALSSTAIT